MNEDGALSPPLVSTVSVYTPGVTTRRVLVQAEPCCPNRLQADFVIVGIVNERFFPSEDEIGSPMILPFSSTKVLEVKLRPIRFTDVPVWPEVCD